MAGISAYASAHFSAGAIAFQVTGIGALGVATWLLLRPLADWLLKKMPVEHDNVPPDLMATILCLIFVMGMCTYKLGIFTIFGGFLAGLSFHRNRRFVDAWRAQVGKFVLVFFLPIFFTYAGLRTNVLGLKSGSDWLWLSVVLAAAVLGKIIPVYIASRASGFKHRESVILGSLDEYARAHGADRAQYRL